MESVQVFHSGSNNSLMQNQCFQNQIMVTEGNLVGSFHLDCSLLKQQAFF